MSVAVAEATGITKVSYPGELHGRVKVTRSGTLTKVSLIGPGARHLASRVDSSVVANKTGKRGRPRKTQLVLSIVPSNI